MKILYLGALNNYFKQFESDCLRNNYDVIQKESLTDLENIYHDLSIAIVDADFEKSHSSAFVEKSRDYEKKNLITSSIPIIYISENDSIDSREKGFRQGADDFLDKFDSSSILLKINSIIKPNTLWQGINVVVVEDDLISAKFISHVIKTKGANVINFSDGVEAYEYLKGTDESKVDLILTDHMMPNLSGISFVKKIRNEIGYNTVPIVFISSIENKTEVLDFYKAGGNDYLSKPLIKEELFVKVDQLLSNRFKSKLLERQVNELERVNRVKDQFLAVCTHDLRTPLNTILGLTNLIIEEENIESSTRSYLEQIDKSAGNLLELINELLDLSSLQTGNRDFQLSKLNLVKVIKSSLRNFTAINNKKIHMHFYSSIKDSSILGNETMLLRVFNNLLSNAYKFTPEKGKIFTHVKGDQDWIIVSIEDSGIGIPEKSIENLFNEFSGAGRTGLQGEKSTGLGLSIVKKIIDEHNGYIDVKSTEGKGTTFTIKFSRMKK